MSGYSDTPLIQKLGFKDGESVFVLDTPDWYTDFADVNGVEVSPGLPATHAHVFFTSLDELQYVLQEFDLNDIEKSLWVSWPKKTSGITTDLTEQLLRDEILPLGWVDTKVAAVDDIWSGLKFLRRK